MLDAASLILQAVKAAYDIWKKESVSNLELTEEAKNVLKIMQSDETGDGIFVEETVFGMSGIVLLGLGADQQINTTRRVIAELNAKGIVATTESVIEDRREYRVELTHFGWILDPETGTVNKVG